jgi:hypothetical protein
MGIFSEGAAKHIDAPANKAVRIGFEKNMTKARMERLGRREQ